MTASAGVIASDRTDVRFVPVSAVKMHEGFWKTKMDLNHQHGIPKLLQHLESHGVVDNFMIVSGRKNVERRGPYFTDSDLFKWMEGAAFDIQTYDDPKIKAELDRIIDEVVAAQGDDGYLNTYFQGDLFDQRFRNLAAEHELYCAGHLFQAAVAHYRATGSDKLLAAACRYADYLDSVFGPEKRQGRSGHEEIEMALVELYRTTGEKRYLDLAGYFLDQLGVVDEPVLTGHAVRRMYRCCGAADYLAETGESRYAAALDRMWSDLVNGKIYITGGVGARYAGEAFGEPYELPNLRAYAETCAAIGNVMWNYRMLALTGDAKYADVMEKAFYNGVVSGVSLDGVSYFYTNPLANTGTHQRQEWFGCTCCPTNMVRTLASIPGYIYSTSADGVSVHLYAASRVEHKLADGTQFTLDVETDYPWDGNVDIKLGLPSPKRFRLSLRIPGWCDSAAAAVNGQEIGQPVSGTYFAVERVWNDGDTIHLNFGMPVVLTTCDPRVRENYGCVAVERGPIVFCAESPDNPGVSVMDLELASPDLNAEFDPDLLGGVVKITGTGRTVDASDRGPLYRRRGQAPPTVKRDVPITLIPYYAWANRGPAHMAVWLPFED